MNIAETERVILKRFTHNDVGDMFTVMGDPEVMKYSLNGPLSFDQTQRFIEHAITTYERKGFGLWAVEYKAIGHVIGYCGHYFQTIDDSEEVELGYRTARSFWGKGLATEAARSALHYAFCMLKLPRIISIIEAENIGTI
jgi:RimJ/RimL family protein N-acetyltransferase